MCQHVLMKTKAKGEYVMVLRDLGDNFVTSFDDQMFVAGMFNHRKSMQ
jgi:hypothetical protein